MNSEVESTFPVKFPVKIASLPLSPRIDNKRHLSREESRSRSGHRLTAVDAEARVQTPLQLAMKSTEPVPMTQPLPATLRCAPLSSWSP